jgi:hypothetical protein
VRSRAFLRAKNQTERFDLQSSQIWLVGGGIASMAAAVFLIRDASVPAQNIHILEELGLQGGALDGGKSPVQAGYVTRGGRMLEDEAYQILRNLLESIPSLEDPHITVRDEVVAFNARVKTEDRARLIDSNHRIMDASAYGFNVRDRLELTRLLATSEHSLGARRINEIFSEHFFTANFWQMWRTTFAFHNWHSAAELKRYFLRFNQEFSRIHTLSGVVRTKYNQRQRDGARTHSRSTRWCLVAVGSRVAQGEGFRQAEHLLRQYRREQVGVVHADHAGQGDPESHRGVLGQRARHRRTNDLSAIEVADVHCGALPTSLHGHAAGYLYALGLWSVHR